LGTKSLLSDTRVQKMLKGHLPRVIYHKVYKYTKITRVRKHPYVGHQVLVARHDAEVVRTQGDHLFWVPVLCFQPHRAPRRARV